MNGLRRAGLALTIGGLVGWSTVAAATEFQSVGDNPAILYDAPTLRATKIAIAPRGMPVEIVVVEGDWARIRDSAGGLAWVDRKMLTPRRTVVATASGVVDVHASPDDASPIVFRVNPGVLMDLSSGPTAGWVGVHHRDGANGYVRVASVWGD